MSALRTAVTGTGELVSRRARALWVLDRLDPAGAALDGARVLRLEGRLDVDEVRGALQRMADRHPALRTRYYPTGDGPALEVLPRVAVEVGSEEAPRPGAALDARLVAAASAAYDLPSGSLLRGDLLRTGEGEHLLVVGVHPLAADYQGIARLTRSLLAELAGPRAGDVPGVGSPGSVVTHPTDGDASRAAGYWRARLSGSLPVLTLAPDAAGDVPTQRVGTWRTTTLTPELSGGLRGLARRTGSPLTAVLLASYRILVRRLFAEEDLVVGLPVCLERDPDGTIANHTNTLALRDRLSGDPTLDEVLGRAGQELTGALASAGYPFDELVEQLGDVTRRGVQSPLFQCLLAADEMLLPAVGDVQLSALGLAMGTPPRQWGRLRVRSQALPRRSLPCELSLVAATRGERLRLTWVFDPRRLPARTIDDLEGYYATVLEALAAAPPGTRLSGLPQPRPPAVAPPPTRGGAATSSDVEAAIPRRFLDRVERDPQAVAVRTGAGDVSYERLAISAGGVAEALRATCGDEPGRVGLLLEHGADMIAAILGTLLAGKTYVPLDPLYPERRLALMTRDADVDVVLHSPGTAALGEALGLPSAGLVDATTPLARGAEPRVSATAGPDALASILYTSGSTGRPKGVVQNHRNVLAHARNVSRALGITAEDNLSLLSSFSFDASTTDLYCAVLGGAAVTPIDLRTVGTHRLAEELNSRHVSIYHSTPTVFRHLVARLGAGRRLETLRVVLLGGETVTAHDLDACRRYTCRDCLFVNGYGASEVSFALFGLWPAAGSAGRMPPRASETRQHGAAGGPVLPVGYPLEDIEVLLLDGAGLPTARYGEIALRSPYVALGYWRRPEATSAAFSGTPGGARTYRTGDLGWRLDDGTVLVSRRKDRLVKVRGHRVEPGEVEAALSELDAVDASYVHSIEGADGSALLVAYVAAAAGALTEYDLRAALLRALPSYAVPQAFVILPELPLTPTNKIDVRALPAPAEPPAGALSGPPPDGSLERLIADAWCAALGVDAVPAETSFFDLGGTSLEMADVQARLAVTFDLDVPLVRLFEFPTVRSLARHLDGGSPAGRDAGAGAVAVRERMARRASARTRHARRKRGRDG